MAVKNLKISTIFMKIGIQGFVGSLITNLQSDFQISRWRIQHGGQKFENQSDFHENHYTGVLGSLITILQSDFENSRWRIQYGGLKKFAQFL